MRQVSVVMVGLVLCGGLAGCSGAGKFFRDTGLPPGSNPNAAGGDGETMSLVRGQGVANPPLLPEAGNVWPGPPKPFPTLQDVAAHPDAGTGGYNPLLGNVPGGASGSMASGESMSMGGGDFSGGGDGGVPSARSAPLPSMPTVPRPALPSGTPQNGKVVIPNGDGTQTVINPDGTVATVPAHQ